MSKIITIVGATGLQGSAVITALAGDPKYTLRGLTRNPESRKAQELRNKGVEVVKAEIDDLSSLKSAFAGSYAIYGVTGIEEIMANQDLEDIAEAEAQLGINIAQVAAETAGLQHFIWSTLPPAAQISDGRYHLPNHVGKNKVDDFIRSNASLAAKTTFLMIGQYHSNYSFNAISMYLIATADTYVQFASHPPDTPVYWIGDVTRNLVPFVKPIIEQSEKTKGNVVFAYADVHTAEESLQIWAKAKGVKAVSVPVSAELLRTLWGKYADVLGAMWRYWGDVKEKSWSAPGQTVLMKEDLGVTELISLADSFKDYEL
ncbi:hypothetical protein F5Y19DRAFT_454730 [Xylariaceae sp. FL1651]|nr:hypothetical protein F5Y19DRAFT_454730 [Xylariaceae sp. FL1651]